MARSSFFGRSSRPEPPASAGSWASPADLARLLDRADRLRPDDPARGDAQRRVARLVRADPSVADDRVLAHRRQQLLGWARWVPYLLDDPTEQRVGAAARLTVDDALGRLAALDADPFTGIDAVERSLVGLDDGDPARRAAADADADARCAARAPAMARVVHDLTASHAADDGRRGIVDWRARACLIHGLDLAAARHSLAAVHDATPMARRWYTARERLVGTAYSDRRAGLAIAPTSLADDAGAVAAALAVEVPVVGDLAGAAARAVRPGPRNEVRVERDGGLSVHVEHRPTARSRLMAGHELGHAVHVLVARDAGAPEAPGALVAETVACWSALACGRRWQGGAPAAAWALALGDHLVEELFVSALVSRFEDEIQATVRAGGHWDHQVAAAVWLGLVHELVGDTVDVPVSAQWGWARLTSLATEPGAAFHYVWATLLALSVDDSAAVAELMRLLVDVHGVPWEPTRCRRCSASARAGSTTASGRSSRPSTG